MEINSATAPPLKSDPTATRAYEQTATATATETATETKGKSTLPAGEGAPEAAGPTGTEDVSPKDADKIVETLNENMDKLQTRLGFKVNDDSEEIIVTVINRETDEVVRQIPSKELLELKDKMDELTGILLNEKA